MWGYLAIVLLLTVACSYERAEPPAVLDFVIDDPELESIFLEALQKWTDVGVVAAGQATVNVNPNGMKVKWQTPEDSLANCIPARKTPLPKGKFIGGCSRHRGAKWYDTLWITRLGEAEIGNVDAAQWRRAIVTGTMHEIIHVIVPTADHLPPGTVGILSSNPYSSGGVITDADLQFLKERTLVV